MADSVIRPATSCDLADIASLHASVFSDGWPVPFWQEQLEAPTSYLLVAGPLGRCEAVILARRIVDEAEIITLAVAPLSRRLGLASALLAHVEQILRGHRPCRLFLEVSIENQPARALYTRRGFVETGRRKGYYTTSGAGGAVDALILSLDLKA